MSLQMTDCQTVSYDSPSSEVIEISLERTVLSGDDPAKYVENPIENPEAGW